jgi:hypothetical protein
MYQKVQLGIYMLGLVLLGPNLAHAATKTYVSGAFGSLSHGDTSLIVSSPVDPPTTPPSTQETTFTSSSDDSNVINLAWGVASDTVRFGFEYYNQTSNLSGFDAEYTKHSLFYSGYWTPNLFVPKLYGILGAGVGGAQLDLDSDDARIGDDFTDREHQFKITIGVEYRFLDGLAAYGGWERHFTSTYSDWITDEDRLTFKEDDQSGIVLGVIGRF